MQHRYYHWIVLLAIGLGWNAAWGGLDDPIVNSDLVFEEQDGMLAIEAEHFYKQTKTDKRTWYRISRDETPDSAMRDVDPKHVEGAGNGAYIEILPDTRASEDEPLVHGENFSNEPGVLAVLHYRACFQNPGRYYVWVRAHSTGTDDNGVHVGIDGQWPESGQRLQWCDGKNTWRWESRQRTPENHCGEPGLIFLDIEEPGVHDIMFSMREDGFEMDRFLLTLSPVLERPQGVGPAVQTRDGRQPPSYPLVERKPDGDGSVEISGELKTWHKVTLTLDGPFAHERDTDPNPFTDYAMTVMFTHESGEPSYSVPGYFAADGNAAETSAESGNKWRAHLSPDKTGKWTYGIAFPDTKYDGLTGEFMVAESDKSGRDFRARGRLEYVGKRYLQFAGSGEYFFKAGADAPETFLAYRDFDGTVANKNIPLKTWAPHLRDWRSGDPTWQDGKGKGMIGAVNYMAEKGVNAISFLTYNRGGDGDNVWPFVERDAVMHYDCSKLDQWAIVIEHMQHRGIYAHFKLQETENDNEDGISLDGGELGRERRLYYRELIARFGHNLALNWNLGEENTQTMDQQRAMARFFHENDPYRHNVVIHTYPNEQDKVYGSLLGDGSLLTGASLQNEWNEAHRRTLKWITESAKAGRPWVVANDEQGSAGEGVPPDPGYEGFEGIDYDLNDIRKQTLWGTLMAGGAGVEYYFGYQLPQNDLVAEDYRSRDRSWDFCRIAIEFFQESKLPFIEMVSRDDLIGNPENGRDKYCLAQPGEVYLVYLGYVSTAELDLSDADGSYQVQWFNPREGGGLQSGSVETVRGGDTVALGSPPTDPEQDWLVIIRARQAAGMQ